MDYLKLIENEINNAKISELLKIENDAQLNEYFYYLLMEYKPISGSFKGFDLLKRLLDQYPDFYEKIKYGFVTHKIRFFDEREWNRIKFQNFRNEFDNKNYGDFVDVFFRGGNIGKCLYIAKQLSYAYDDVNIVYGTNPYFVKTENSLNGGHRWLEVDGNYIDTSLLLIIDVKYAEQILGYKVAEKDLAYEILINKLYQSAKEFALNEHLMNSQKNEMERKAGLHG